VFASPWASAQVPPPGQPTVSVEELARQLHQTQQQLHQTRRELQYLRGRDLQRQTWEESIIKRLPSTEPTYRPASYRRGSRTILSPVHGASPAQRY
jgi:hypothetical protein